MKLPSNNLVYPSTPITTHFTWSEATNNCTRIPLTLAIEHNIINTAINLEKIRHLLGDRPLIITSWYRTPSVNNNTHDAVKNSLHLTGLAIDFKSLQLTPLQIYQILDPIHPGGLGLYSTFCHLDYRNWLGKPQARWSKL